MKATNQLLATNRGGQEGARFGSYYWSCRGRPAALMWLVLGTVAMVFLTVWGHEQQLMMGHHTDDTILGFQQERGSRPMLAKKSKPPLRHKNHTRVKHDDDDDDDERKSNSTLHYEFHPARGDRTHQDADHSQKSSSDNNHEDNKNDRLIDFGVMGFEKSGTTFLLDTIFSKSKQVFMAGAETGSEVQALHPDKVEELKAMFPLESSLTTAEQGVPIRRGFKNPMVFMNRPWLENLQDNFPTTRFIVTVRHPILWFQSWYNYKLRTGNLSYRMPTPHETVGLCREACRHKGPEGRCITVRSPGCSGHSNFHQYLSRMGYTPMDTEDELSLLGHHQMRIFNFSQTSLFLTDLTQMDGQNTTVSDGLIRDMERFLDLEEYALPNIEPYHPPSYTWTKDRLEGSIDICDDDYADIRAHLLETGRKAGEWIEHYFLESPHVIVSDRSDFIRRIRHWTVDPCI
jgi:hypothetical protein